MPMMKSVALIAAVLLQHVGAQTPEDTYIWQSAPNTNYGSASSITVDQSDGNAGTPTRGLVKFNGISIPAGYGLDSATLKINSVNPTSGTVSAFRMLEPWSDSSTWSTLNNGNPSRETTPSFLIPAPSSGVVLEFDVTSDVAGWIDAPSTNEGWIFISDSTNGWDFTSAESSNPPELVLSTTKLIEDTYIWEGSPGSSYGSEDEITVDDVDSGYPTRGLLKFNNLSIEPGQFIESATLKINSVNPTSGTISAYRMIDSWSETSTWSQLSNGNPARAATTSFEIDAPSSGVVLQFDVTSDVEGWLQSPSTNQGWIFISDSSNGWDFTTSESSNPPELVITTSSVPMPTPVDTYIWGGSVGSSYGSDTSISVDESDGGYPSRGLIKFTGIVVPAGRSLDSATLKINSINPTSGTVSAYRMLTPWNDTSSWSQLNNGNPARLSTPSFEVISPSSGVVLEFDVTSDVQAWLANTTVNQGWFFLSDSTDGWDFTSAESSNPPQLILATSPDDGVDPTPAPVGPVPMCPNGPATYHPGDLTVTLDDSLSTGSLLVSTGLNGRVLTRDGQSVQFDNGAGSSSASMHSRADGAAVVPDDSNPNRYYLVSNSESSSGGVGILHFDASTTPHSVIGYRRTAENTNTGSRNCGGGRTPWGTWLTSEESGSGSVNEVDPNDPDTSNSNCRDGGNCCRTPLVPPEGGNYESNAFWASPTDNKYHFYTTEDAGSDYRLTRFIPDDDIPTMLAKPRKLDRLCGATGQLRYLRLICTAGCGGSRPSGTFTWSTSRTPASGDQAYPNAEGIDVKGTDLYFITKGQRRLYIVDLTGTTWRSGETIQSDSGSEFSPDQVARITGSNSPDDILYFCEDGSGSQDIHARGLDANGDYRFFTIIRGYTSTESTGLTFSTDNKMMYFAHQSESEIWQIWREDGCAFGDGNYIDVKYHDFDPFRMLRGAKMPEIVQGKGEAVFDF